MPIPAYVLEFVNQRLTDLFDLMCSDHGPCCATAILKPPDGSVLTIFIADEETAKAFHWLLSEISELYESEKTEISKPN